MEGKLSIKHRFDLKDESFLGRKAVHVIDVIAEGTFHAHSSAVSYLRENGYCVGSMERDRPIGFMYGYDYVSKWKNMTSSEQNTLDGVILPMPEFREGNARIVFFVEPKS